MTFGVCIPCLNGSTTLHATLESIALQTLPFDEILLCDNGSHDNSFAIMNSFRESHDFLPIRTIRFSRPLGMAADWNRAVSMLQTDWRSVLPCDDIIARDWLETHRRASGFSSQIVMSAVAKHLVSASGRRLPIKISRIPAGIHCGPDIRRRVISHPENIVGEPGAVFFRASAFEACGGFDDTIHYYTDVDCWIRLLKLGDLIFSSNPCYGFRIHGDSLTSKNILLAHSEWIKILEKYGAGAGMRESPNCFAKAKSKATLVAKIAALFILRRL